MSIAKAIKAVKSARDTLAKAENDLREIRKRRAILCACEKKHAIGKLELLVTHWYTRPSGCTDGDYWTEGEWQFVCPVDGMRNRFMFDDYKVEYEKRGHVGVAAEPTFKTIYRGLFASSRDVYDKSEGGGNFNNYYVDKNRKKFELPAMPERK